MTSSSKSETISVVPGVSVSSLSAGSLDSRNAECSSQSRMQNAECSSQSSSWCLRPAGHPFSRNACLWGNSLTPEISALGHPVQTMRTGKWKWKSLGSVPLFATPWTVVHGILQARTLEWVAFPFSRGSSQPRDPTQVSCLAGDSLPAEPQSNCYLNLGGKLEQRKNESDVMCF